MLRKNWLILHIEPEKISNFTSSCVIEILLENPILIPK